MMFDQPPNNPIPGPSGVVGLERASSSSRKRSMDDQGIEAKRPRYDWYVKLESESSSLASEDDTESVYSIQGYETERIQDTPDTDTKSEYSNSSDVNFEVEYEVDDDDPSGDEGNPFAGGNSSSGTEDVLAAAAAGAAIAAAICDKSMEAWLTGGEDSDNSSAGDTEINHTDFWTCVQCKSQNNNPRFRYCQKCFQMRKNLFPPRPRGHRKRQGKGESKAIEMSIQQKTPESTVDSGIGSQDSVMGSLNSGIGSQESGFGSGQDVPTFDLAIASTSNGTQGLKRKSSSMVKSEHLTVNGDDSSKRSRTEDVTNGNISGDENKQLTPNGFIKIENNNDTDEEQKDIKIKSDETFEFTKPKIKEETEFVKPVSIPKQKYPYYEDKMCILCESESQNSVFVHAGMGCLCCCYKCANRTWATHKKCPACTRKIKNIIRINKS